MRESAIPLDRRQHGEQRVKRTAGKQVGGVVRAPLCGGDCERKRGSKLDVFGRFACVSEAAGLIIKHLDDQKIGRFSF
jgi:hypothetical protein